MSLPNDCLFPTNELSKAVENFKALPSKKNKIELFDTFILEIVVRFIFVAITTVDNSHSKFLAIENDDKLYVKVYSCRNSLSKSLTQFYKRYSIKSLFELVASSEDYNGVCFDYLDNQGYFLSKEEIKELLLVSKNYLAEYTLKGQGHLYEARPQNTYCQELGYIFSTKEFVTIESLKFLSNGEFFNYFFIVDFCKIIEKENDAVYELNNVFQNSKKYIVVSLFKKQCHTPNEYMIRATHLFKVVAETESLDGICIKDIDEHFIYLNKEEIKVLNNYFSEKYLKQISDYNSLEKKGLLKEKIAKQKAITEKHRGFKIKEKLYVQQPSEPLQKEQTNQIISFVKNHMWICSGISAYFLLLILCSIIGHFDFEGFFTFAFIASIFVTIIVFCLYALFSKETKEIGESEERAFFFPSMVAIISAIFIFSSFIDIKNESENRRYDKELEKYQYHSKQNTSNVPLEDCFSPNGEWEDYTVYTTLTGEKYHEENCKYLQYSEYSIDLYDAILQGYTPCNECRPPKLNDFYKEFFGL